MVFPRKEPIVDTLISKALSGVRPFFSGKFEGKSHSDAGFKDSLIAETIYQYHAVNKNLCIFITNDQDFSREFSRKIQPGSELVLFTSIDINDSISRNNAENNYLSSLREILLSKLMSGELDVSDIRP